MKRFFDYDDGDFGIELSDSLLLDQDGHLMQKVSDNLAINLDSGDLHLISINKDPDNE